jgi:hypothetical protein
LRQKRTTQRHHLSLNLRTTHHRGHRETQRNESAVVQTDSTLRALGLDSVVNNQTRDHPHAPALARMRQSRENRPIPIQSLPPLPLCPFAAKTNNPAPSPLPKPPNNSPQRPQRNTEK